MAPDTQQNIIIAGKLLLTHNGLAIMFLLGIVSSIAYALYRPSRGAVLLIVGFSLLLMAFEYDKHIAEPLIKQTTTSLITERQSWRLAWVVEKLLDRLVTPLFYISGALSAVSGLMLVSLTGRRKKSCSRKAEARNESV